MKKDNKTEQLDRARLREMWRKFQQEKAASLDDPTEEDLWAFLEAEGNTSDGGAV